MPRIRDEAKVARAAELYHSDKLTEAEVARVMQVGVRTVRRWLAGSARPPGPRPAANDQMILRLKKEGLSFQQIAVRVHMSKTGVRLRYGALTGRPRPDRPPKDQAGATPAGDRTVG